MKIARLQIAGLFGIAIAVFLVTAVSAGQAPKPAAAAAQAAPAAAKASPESIASGEALYKRNCQTCHGATGVGDGPASKTLKGKLPNLTDKAAMAKIKDTEIHDALENGLKTEVGNMPAFKTRMKPEEMQDVISYVRSLAK